MSPAEPTNVTALLDRIRAGDSDASALLLEAVYGELRGLAGAVFASGMGGRRTLQPTALVHEAWMKLDGRMDAFEGRTHFFAVAAKAMRHVLADHARRLRAEKRGGGRPCVTLAEGGAVSPLADVDAVDLDDSLARLAALNERHARVVEYRLFGGMTVPEIARFMDVSPRTVDADWSIARAWLVRELFEV